VIFAASWKSRRLPTMAEAGFSIRDARPEEYERIGEIAVAAYTALEPIDDYIDEIRDTAARAAVARVLIAAESDGAILGTVTYIPGPGPLSERERDDEAGFRVLAVDPAVQGRGIGRALAEACVARAVQEGRAGVAILTRPSMVSAHRLYESMGFARDREDDWEFLPGEWLWGYRLRF
jgi:GNAT superfamily N-acetyltransferase